MIRNLILAVVLAAATVAQAQSDTGRHRPQPPPAPPEAVTATAPSAWHIGLNFGLASSGDLFRARSPGNGPWDPEGGTPFGSSDFVVTFDEGFAYGVSVLRDLGAWVSLRADAAFTQLPMTAEARVGETVRIYEYDDLSLASFTAGVEVRLTRAASHPYLSAGVGATVAGSSRTDAHDQTVFAGRFGVGFHQVLSPSLALRLEIANTRQSLDFEDYLPPTTLPVYPSVTVENLGPQNILGMTAGLVASF
jgi:hypothetical protein